MLRTRSNATAPLQSNFFWSKHYESVCFLPSYKMDHNVSFDSQDLDLINQIISAQRAKHLPDNIPVLADGDVRGVLKDIETSSTIPAFSEVISKVFVVIAA